MDNIQQSKKINTLLCWVVLVVIYFKPLYWSLWATGVGVMFKDTTVYDQQGPDLNHQYSDLSSRRWAVSASLWTCSEFSNTTATKTKQTFSLFVYCSKSCVTHQTLDGPVGKVADTLKLLYSFLLSCQTVFISKTSKLLNVLVSCLNERPDHFFVKISRHITINTFQSICKCPSIKGYLCQDLEGLSFYPFL